MQQAVTTISVRIDTHEIALNYDDDVRFNAKLSMETQEPGVHLIHLSAWAESPAIPPIFTLSFVHPARDIHASWHPSLDRNKSYHADWMRQLRSNAATSAPVYSLFNVSSRNRLTFAFSDALNTVLYTGCIREESAEFLCSLQLFTEASAPLSEYKATLRIDTRDLFYYECLKGVQEWWSRMPEYSPAYVPKLAKGPMYSTWYSMHQEVTAAGIEEQCRIAKQLGMSTVIVDDGWQTGDNRRGYAYTGDWEAYEGKFPDMRRHVDTVHELGMKLILWYSVPFVGKYSQLWERFKNKILRYSEGQGAGVLDPRYPDVREYIIGKYEQAVLAWDLDGFKLDFVDAFYASDSQSASETEGRDIHSIPEAVDRLLSDSIDRLRRLKPDMMVEFRQTYIGPAMRKYGNMLRASDCPNDSIQNRVRTNDIRLLSGDTAVHADMVMWHEEEPVESAALQLINVLFSVPQISVRLDRLPPDHLRMLRYWLTLWNDYREVLLDGSLEPLNPELLYPLVRAAKGSVSVIAAYGNIVVPLSDDERKIREWVIVNGRLREGVYIEVSGSIGRAEVELRTCCGDTIGVYELELNGGIHKLAIPPSGIGRISLSDVNFNSMKEE